MHSPLPLQQHSEQLCSEEGKREDLGIGPIGRGGMLSDDVDPSRPPFNHNHNNMEYRSRASSSQGDLSTASYYSYDTGLSVASSAQSKENNNMLGGGLGQSGDTPLFRHYSFGTSSTTSSNRSMKRSVSRNVFSDAEMHHAQQQKLTLTKYFGHDINEYTSGSPEVPTFDKELRRFIDPHIAKARKSREDRRCLNMDKLGIPPRVIESLSISSNAYTPYPILRNERPFLFDVETYPLHTILAETLGLKDGDLSKLHEHSIKDKRKLVSPLLDAKKRKAFHACYDNFVNTFCIPLLHSLAMVQNMFNDFSRDPAFQKINYRYQAFPCLRIVRPGEFSIGPHCDMAYGHSMGNINFHIPLTPTFGTNCLFTESHPGREDWHPLKTKSVGLGYAFDGARCLHFTLENTTQSTRVSLDFRIAIYRERSSKNSSPSPSPSSTNLSTLNFLSNKQKERDEEENDNGDCIAHDSLCHPKVLQDNYSKFPGYYEEAYIELGPHFTDSAGSGTVVQKKNKLLMHPDKRVGFPF